MLTRLPERAIAVDEYAQAPSMIAWVWPGTNRIGCGIVDGASGLPGRSSPDRLPAGPVVAPDSPVSQVQHRRRWHGRRLVSSQASCGNPSTGYRWSTVSARPDARTNGKRGRASRRRGRARSAICARQVVACLQCPPKACLLAAVNLFAAVLVSRSSVLLDSVAIDRDVLAHQALSRGALVANGDAQRWVALTDIPRAQRALAQGQSHLSVGILLPGL